ncbi:MAG: 2OG-Fe(II) oxygenase [Bacteroidia bacterium]|nr:2OG-Fe(II) oxygenase [Bacteroidia bacterium]
MSILTSVSPILKRDSLYREDLNSLFRGDILAIRIKQYISAEESSKLSRKIIKAAGFDHYSIAKELGIFRTGMSFFETTGNPRQRGKYHVQAISAAHEIRSICSPFLSPLDLFHLNLEEVWPKGAHIERIHGMKMQPGTIRMFRGDMENTLPPHQDILRREAPKSSRALSMKTQLAANIYLKTPHEGGELELWDVQLSDQEFEDFRNHTHDFIDRDKLPGKSVKIKPEEGELILFQSPKVHTVHPCNGDIRMAMSCFVGYYGENEALTYWI